MKSKRRWQSLGFALITAMPAVAFADGEMCLMHQELPVERQLRRLSIDLRGTVPDVAEYDAVKGLDAVPDEIIDSYLASDEFRVQMRRYHESLLWTNPNPALSDVAFSLSSVNYGGTPVYFVPSTGKRRIYRGGDGTYPCQDKPQADLGYDANGLPNVEYMGKDSVGDWYAEGWVEVHPYWDADPNKKIKVCAFDAQTNETYTIPVGQANAGTYSCDHVEANSRAKSCGCGPELNYCMLTSVVQPLVLSSMREQLLRFVDEVTNGTAPYSSILTSRRVHYNGPLSHYFRYLAQRQSYSRTQNEHQPADGPLPDIAFTQVDNWVAVEREAPHAGVLTLPAFLLRFQTNRSRANRYRIAFLGEYFPPADPNDTNCNREGDDLMKRCVCRGCHEKLEPLAAYFGQFAEMGSMSLRDYTREYATRNACAKGSQPSSTGWCDRHYEPVPDASDPDIRSFRLKPLRYADSDPLHEDIQPNFDAGPAGIFGNDPKSGPFHEVAVKQLFTLFMKRAPINDPTAIDYEGDALKQIAEDFKMHDSLHLAVRDIVKLSAYRRTP